MARHNYNPCLLCNLGWVIELFLKGPLEKRWKGKYTSAIKVGSYCALDPVYEWTFRISVLLNWIGLCCSGNTLHNCSIVNLSCVTKCRCKWLTHHSDPPGSDVSFQLKLVFQLTSTVSTGDGKYKRRWTGIGSFEEFYPVNMPCLSSFETWNYVYLTWQVRNCTDRNTVSFIFSYVTVSLRYYVWKVLKCHMKNITWHLVNQWRTKKSGTFGLNMGLGNILNVHDMFMMRFLVIWN